MAQNTTRRRRGHRGQGQSQRHTISNETVFDKFKNFLKNHTFLVIIISTIFTLLFYYLVLKNYEQGNQPRPGFSKEKIKEEFEFADGWIRLVQSGFEYFKQMTELEEIINNSTQKLETGPEVVAFKDHCDQYDQLYSEILGQESQPDLQKQNVRTALEFAKSLEIRFQNLKRDLLKDKYLIENKAEITKSSRRDVIAIIRESDGGESILSNEEDAYVSIEKSRLYDLGQQLPIVFKQMATSLRNMHELNQKIGQTTDVEIKKKLVEEYKIENSIMEDANVKYAQMEHDHFFSPVVLWDYAKQSKKLIEEVMLPELNRKITAFENHVQQRLDLIRTYSLELKNEFNINLDGGMK